MRMSDWSSDLCSSDLKVVRGGLMHGKTSPVSHDGTGLFEGLPSSFTATRYHSLVVQDIPPELIVNATSNDTMVMGFRHSSMPIHGVHFHPANIATEHADRYSHSLNSIPNHEYRT